MRRMNQGLICVMKTVIAGVILTGCVSTSNVDVTPYIELPPPPKVKMRDVTWNVINVNENADTYMCLDPHNYSNMSLNMNDIKLFMIYQTKMIKIMKEQ